MKKIQRTLIGSLFSTLVLLISACTGANTMQTSQTPISADVVQTVMPTKVPETTNTLMEESIYEAGFSQQQLFANVFTLYYVNCATENVTELGENNYMGLMQSVTDQTGFYYDFEVPKGEYEIICGFSDPFCTRKVDICVEEKSKNRFLL